MPCRSPGDRSRSSTGQRSSRRKARDTDLGLLACNAKSEPVCMNSQAIAQLLKVVLEALYRTDGSPQTQRVPCCAAVSISFRSKGLSYRPSSTSPISRFRISMCLRSSRAMPVVSPGDCSRATTLASSSRFFASVF
jgi:hypothetical protein